MQNIAISKKTRLKLVEIRNNNNFRSHDETIRELIEVLSYAEEIAKERDDLKEQLESRG